MVDVVHVLLVIAMPRFCLLVTLLLFGWHSLFSCLTISHGNFNN
jgi:hypothetical protein